MNNGSDMNGCMFKILIVGIRTPGIRLTLFESVKLHNSTDFNGLFDNFL